MAFEVLKRETQDLHRRVEQAVDIESVCTDLYSYRALLSRLLGYYEPLEALLGGFSWHFTGLDFSARRKSALLRRDLAMLGLSDAEQAALPRCNALPRPRSMAGALGVMYVLEGATLGGQVVLRAIDIHLRLGAHSGAAFHAGYGAHNGSMWHSFKQAATRQLDSTEHLHAAVQAARETFLSYETWLTGAAQVLPYPSNTAQALEAERA
jgi:heme oxygenase (biliverdin-IX-beta and delta-forming)